MAKDRDSLYTDLAKLIPGYGAYREQESRRADDRLTREFLVKRLSDCKTALDQLGLLAVAQGDLNSPVRIEKLRNQVELVRGRIAAAVEGYAGWFSQRSVDAKLLQQIGEIDQNMVSLVDQIDSCLRNAGQDISKLQEQAIEELLERLLGRIDRRTELLRAS